MGIMLDVINSKEGCGMEHSDVDVVEDVICSVPSIIEFSGLTSN